MTSGVSGRLGTAIATNKRPSGTCLSLPQHPFGQEDRQEDRRDLEVKISPAGRGAEEN